ncbi:MAG: hypothetical protein ACI9ON_001501 [Limisphaerales bacterium]|jgi:hypothetical protein
MATPYLNWTGSNRRRLADVDYHLGNHLLIFECLKNCNKSSLGPGRDLAKRMYSMAGFAALLASSAYGASSVDLAAITNVFP